MCNHNDHPLDAAFIVQLTQMSTGSTHLSDPTDRRGLARSIRAARRQTAFHNAAHRYAGPYRIFDHWTPRRPG